MFRETFETNVFGAASVIHEFLPLVRAADAGRIVNVSSTMCSLADQGDPSSPYYALGVRAYRVSKLALNGDHGRVGQAPRGRADHGQRDLPGSVQTDLAPGNRESAPSTPEEGSLIVGAMAIGDDGPSGRFVDRNGTVPW